MGGEWWFAINKKVERLDLNLDLKKYQAELIQLRNRFQSKILQRSHHGEDPSDEIVVDEFWCADEALPPDDNRFARFRYHCRRRGSCYGPKGHKISRGVWSLYWNPNIVPEERQSSNVDARYSPVQFSKISFEIQKSIMDSFPKAFELYVGDGESGFDERHIDNFYIGNRGWVTRAEKRAFYKEK